VEFGLSLLPDCGPDQKTPQQYYDDMLEFSVRAEQHGLSYVKITEHYLRPYGGYCPSPLGFLAAVAARTSQIRLMTGGIQASFHHPIQLAAEAAQLDAISKGRLDVGFARAFLPYEFDAFGVDMDTSRERFQATVEAVIRLWCEKDVSETNQFFSYDGVRSYPPPTQKPHPPVWAAAVLSPSSFEYIGRAGLNLLIAAPPKRTEFSRLRELLENYRTHFEASAGSRSGKRPRIAMSVPLLIHESDERGKELGRRYIYEHWSAFSDAASSWNNRSSTAYQGYQAAVRQKFGRAAAATSDFDATAAFGDPQSVIDTIEEIKETFPIDVLLWQLDFGCQPAEVMSRTVELFGEKVMSTVQ
jgi:alkanesulfonate monooxygenase SsuD/methylene tetrahydromethanopterin reductase-like flavin-dependent oxidoreductase (luciferase family)